MIIFAPRLIKFFTNDFAIAVAIYPFIFIAEKGAKGNKVLINHERIHLRQQVELLIIPFYFWYLVEYLVNRLKGMKHFKAYTQISFEKEAYSQEKNLRYLHYRKFASFLKYL